VRRSLSRLSGDVEDLGDEFDQLGGQAEGGTEAAEEAVEDLQRTVSRIDFDELGDEAMDAADEVALAASLMEEELEGVQEALDDISTLGARRQMRRLGQEVENVMLRTQALDAQSIDIDADVDRSGPVRSVGDGESRGRLPGELDEVADTARLIGSLGPAAQASIAGITALTGVLVGAGGLSAAAIKAASETGVLEDELAGLKAQGKLTARDFAKTFAPTLESDVFPALRNLMRLIREADDELRDFTAGTFEFFNMIRRAREGREGGLLGQAAGTAASEAGPLLVPRLISDATGDSLPLPERGPLGFFGSLTDPRGQEGEGAAARIKNQLRAVQTALEKARGQFAVRDLFGIEKSSTLQQKVSTLEKLRDKLIKTRAAVDLGKAPQQWRRLDSQIQNLQSSLEKARVKLENLRTEPPPAPDVPQVTPENRVLSQKVSFKAFDQIAPKIAALNQLRGKLQRINAMPLLPKAKKSQKEIRSVIGAVRGLQRQGKLLSKTALRGFLRNLNLSEKQIKRIIKRLKQAGQQSVKFGAQLERSLKTAGVRALARSFQTLGSAIAGAKNTAEKMKRVVSGLLKTAGSLLLRFAILGSGGTGLGVLGGLGILGSGLISSLDSGGKILSDGIAKVHEGETVVPANVTESLDRMIADVSALVQPATPSVQPADISGGGPMKIKNEIDISGKMRMDGRDLIHAVRHNLNIERRVGGPGDFSRDRYRS